jgi:hypothetical protein
MAPPRPAISAVCLERSLVLRLIAQDLASDARDKRGLAFAAPLVGRAKPVPAFQLVGVAALCRTDHEARLFSSLRTSTRALRDKARALQRPFPAALFATGVEDDPGDQFRASVTMYPADRVLIGWKSCWFVEGVILTQQGYGRRDLNEGKDAGSASGDCAVTGTISQSVHLN